VCNMIKTIIFDLGGVIITLDQKKAIERFKALGIEDAADRLDPYRQSGIFGDLEMGKIDAETFRKELSALAGKDLTIDQCNYAWQGYVGEVPQRNLKILRRLREEGYRLVLLSNTNPFMMEFVLSGRFDGKGHGLGDYLDALYMSYEVGMMKPDINFFHHVLMQEKLMPEDALFVDDGPRNVAVASQMRFRTFCPENGADWTSDIYKYLV